MHAPQIALTVLLGCAVLYTIFGWTRRYGALSGRSRLFRTIGLILLDLLLALALMWFFIFAPENRGAIDPHIWVARQAIYLLSCVLLILFLLCIATVDALETLSAARREEKAFIQDMLRGEIERARIREGIAQGGATPEPPSTSEGGSAA